MAYYNSGFTATNPNTTDTSPITDLASNLTSCWSPNGRDGRQMDFDGGAGWIFPAQKYHHTYSGQIIQINNQSGSAFSCGAGTANVFSGGTWHYPNTYFNISNNYIYVYMLTSQNNWIQIRQSSNEEGCLLS